MTDGGQTALSISRDLADFLRGASRSLDLALYDIRVDGAEERPILEALLDAHERGVAVRVAYNVSHPGPIPVPPPPTHVPDILEQLPVQTLPIPGVPDLMHHKYAIRDGDTVLTGSMNWTEDSWTRQENVIAVVRSPKVARAYTLNFEELWSGGVVAETGHLDAHPIEVKRSQVRVWFTPGRGTSLAHRIAHKIDRAQHRIRICSPVVSSGPILGTLAQVATDDRIDVAGVVDATQTTQVITQWHANGNASWKIPLLQTAIEEGGFTGKRSTPWAPGTVHDFMHAKVTVTDDTVFVGSFNLSRSGELNAENVLEIANAELADRLAAYVDDVRNRYGAMVLPSFA